MTDQSMTRKSSSPSSRHALHGLSLPQSALSALTKRGIYCMPGVSAEHQHLAKRYVLRGVESGGAVVDMGRACAFLSPDGGPLPWLQSIDSIAVNGRHAIYIAESLLRIDMLRIARTCELAITLHTLSATTGKGRPGVASRLLFRGRDGQLPSELWDQKVGSLRGQVVPAFYDRAGEPTAIPARFEEAIRKVTSQLYVEGKLRTQSWDDRATGEKKYRTEVLVNELTLLGSGRPTESGGNRQRNKGSHVRSNSASSNKSRGVEADEYAYVDQGITDDDIPF